VQRTGLSQELKVEQANVLDRDMRQHHRRVAKDLAYGQNALEIQALHHNETSGCTVALVATRAGERTKRGGAEVLLLLLLVGVVCGSRQRKGGDARAQDEKQEPEEGRASTTAHVLVLASLLVVGVESGRVGERGRLDDVLSSCCVQNTRDTFSQARPP